MIPKIIPKATTQKHTITMAAITPLGIDLEHPEVDKETEMVLC